MPKVLQKKRNTVTTFVTRLYLETVARRFDRYDRTQRKRAPHQAITRQQELL